MDGVKKGSNACLFTLCCLLCEGFIWRYQWVLSFFLLSCSWMVLVQITGKRRQKNGGSGCIINIIRRAARPDRPTTEKITTLQLDEQAIIAGTAIKTLRVAGTGWARNEKLAYTSQDQAGHGQSSRSGQGLGSLWSVVHYTGIINPLLLVLRTVPLALASLTTLNSTASPSFTYKPGSRAGTQEIG